MISNDRDSGRRPPLSPPSEFSGKVADRLWEYISHKLRLWKTRFLASNLRYFLVTHNNVTWLFGVLKPCLTRCRKPYAEIRFGSNFMELWNLLIWGQKMFLYFFLSFFLSFFLCFFRLFGSPDLIRVLLALAPRNLVHIFLATFPMDYWMFFRSPNFLKP